MGTTLNLDCTSCGLQGRDLDVGTGRDRSDGPFEARLFWCPKCEKVDSHVVLEPVDDVREGLEGIAEHGHGWAGAPARVEMSYEEFVAALLQAHLWPRCACGGRCQVATLAKLADAGTHRCPRCRKDTLAATAVMMWD